MKVSEFTRREIPTRVILTTWRSTSVLDCFTLLVATRKAKYASARSKVRQPVVRDVYVTNV